MLTISAITLGCKVNQYDTRAMVERFLARGYTEADADTPTDVVIVNTCTVTGESDRKSRQHIRRANRLNPAASIIVSGCLAQRKAESLALPGVKLILGTARRGEVADLLDKARLSEGALIAVDSDIEEIFEPLSVAQGTEGRTRAIMKIEEGCDCRCAYCIIPSVRGNVRSRSLEEISREAERIASAGYQEIVVTGINLSCYGKDFAMRTDLADALSAIGASGIPRIRLSSLEPNIVSESFLDKLKRTDALCPHFHMALQSGCDATLARMRRPYNLARFTEEVCLLRGAYPSCSITTDMIVGFPAETEEEFARTLDFVRETGFSRLHVFPYSVREGTPAAAMTGQIPTEAKKERAARLIALGRELEQAYVLRKIGGVSSVLFEREIISQGEAFAEGYTEDYLRARLRASSAIGEITDVRLTGYDGDCVSAEKYRA
ncbi:MAG: tRNA (N(6)-L-threonylcarbamoyladenosine(37)-C(2))-methylthiotransferase MtaB [Oscillospiraceae bacterium]|jgi:threonylcarbamoyladenosine tRNA methylthiotransferase MtaB|nr:tRNA (N(6)-L-threonylcarbamoyladenosine(37)-C(2))-methylthiotransferase MtaB [Oscillospiraceae bacterium]